MSLEVIGHPEITELTSSEVSSLIIGPSTIVDLTVTDGTKTEVIITEVSSNIDVVETVQVTIPSLDDIPDGTQYAKVVAKVLQDGKVILEEAIGTLDDIRNGTNYAKLLASCVINGQVDLAQAVGTLDSIAEGVTYGKVKLSALQPGTGFVMTDYLVDGAYAKLKAAAVSVDGFVVMDNIIDGTYARVKASGLTAEGLIVLDEVVDGDYSKVLTTSVLAGQIKITSLVSDAGEAADLDDLPDGTTYSRVASTSIEAGKIKLDEGIVDGTTYARVRSTVLTAGKIILAETVTAAGAAATIDNLADGTTYKRIKAVALDVNGLVVANQIQDAGGYTSKILSSTVSAGKIVLTASDYSGFTANYVAEVSGKYWSPLSDSPAGTGLFITTDYIGYYTGGNWTCYIRNNGYFKFYGGASDYIEWNGSVLTVRGSIVIEDVSGAGALALLDTINWGQINPGSGKPADNATVGATWGTNLSNVPVRFGDTVSSSGVYMTPYYIGFYNASTSSWPIRIVNDSGTGKFFAGGASNYIAWDGSALTIAGAASISGALSAATGTFAGALSAATGTFSGVVTMGSGSTGGGWTFGSTTMYESTNVITLDAANKKVTVGSVSGARVQLSGAGYGSGIFIYNASSQVTGQWSSFYDASFNYSSINLYKYVSGSESLALSLVPGSIGFGGHAGTISGSPLSVTSSLALTLTGGTSLSLNASTGITLSPGSNVTLDSGKALRYGSSTEYLYGSSGTLYYYSSTYHSFVVGSERFVVQGNGVRVVGTHLSVTTANRIYLDAYNGDHYLYSPSDGYMSFIVNNSQMLEIRKDISNSYVKIMASYFILPSGYTTENGSICVSGNKIYFRGGGANYSVTGTAV